MLQVCEQLDVPLSVVPLTQQYWDRVVSHCVNEIRQGRTPNPDVLCNSRVKFGAFYEYLDTLSDRFDRVASGHYARVRRSPNATESSSLHSDGEGKGGAVSKRRDDGVEMVLTPDSLKDQTYFLAHLSQEQLNKVMFPLGVFTKAEVRQLADRAELATKARKDSQGICFLGKVKFNEFVKVLFYLCELFTDSICSLQALCAALLLTKVTSQPCEG
jgi:tRNA-5-taurinomethyluridine 2-sulfurtransferase